MPDIAPTPLAAGPAVLYQDAWIIVLDKPAGLLSVPGIGPQNQDCLARRVAQTVPGARIVHRLDRETSGVIIMALDAESHRALSRQFENREVEKSYVAVVTGVMAAQTGEVDLPLRKDLDRPPRHMVDRERGRPALTRWQVLQRGTDRTRLELRPHTGRSHQLRIHLEAIGHPILGDDLYAPAAVVAMSNRLLLHAKILSVIHPSTGVRMRFEAPCPF